MNQSFERWFSSGFGNIFWVWSISQKHQFFFIWSPLDFHRLNWYSSWWFSPSTSREFKGLWFLFEHEIPITLSAPKRGAEDRWKSSHVLDWVKTYAHTLSAAGSWVAWPAPASTWHPQARDCSVLCSNGALHGFALFLLLLLSLLSLWHFKTYFLWVDTPLGSFPSISLSPLHRCSPVSPIPPFQLNISNIPLSSPTMSLKASFIEFVVFTHTYSHQDTHI